MPVKPLRVVLDTNILVSHLWGGIPKNITDLWKKGKILLALSDPILEEYLAIFAEFGYDEEGLQGIGFFFEDPTRCLMVEPKEQFKACRDPSDDKFLDCAVEAKADAIISGDEDLKSLASFQGIAILSPREFLDTHKRKFT